MVTIACGTRATPPTTSRAATVATKPTTSPQAVTAVAARRSRRRCAATGRTSRAVADRAELAGWTAWACRNAGPRRRPSIRSRARAQAVEDVGLADGQLCDRELAHDGEQHARAGDD